MFKNEEDIKAKIVGAHRRGVCDSNGNSMKVNGVFTAKPRLMSSMAKTYVYRNGEMVLRE